MQVDFGARGLGWAAFALLLSLLVVDVSTAQGPDDADDVVREARRVLASGEVLPPGLASLKREKIKVLFDVSGRGRVRQKRVISLSGTFELDGNTVFFKTARGRRIKKRIMGDDEPKYELDVCFTDADGEPFMVQQAGDEMLIGECDPDNEEEEGGSEGVLGVAFTPEGRENAFQVAQAAVHALQGVQFKKSYELEHAALVSWASLDDEIRDVLDSDCAEESVICEGENGLQSSGTLAAQSHSNSWRHIIDVYAKRIFSRWNIAEHGATVYYRQDPRNQRISYAYRRCNHGSCYNHPAMRHRCRFRSYANRQWHIHRETCTTWYSPCSGAFPCWSGHNSNDDTVIQYRAVRNNRHYPSGWNAGDPCDDPFTRNYVTGVCW